MPLHARFHSARVPEVTAPVILEVMFVKLSCQAEELKKR